VTNANTAHTLKTNTHLDKNPERFLTSTLRWSRDKGPAPAVGSTHRTGPAQERTARWPAYLGDRSCKFPQLWAWAGMQRVPDGRSHTRTGGRQTTQFPV